MLENVLENYNIIEKRDCNDSQVYGLIFLNKKHTTKEFQDAIIDAKNKHYEDIQEFGNDWSFIQEELTDFDYYEISLEQNDYVEF